MMQKIYLWKSQTICEKFMFENYRSRFPGLVLLLNLKALTQIALEFEYHKGGIREYP